MTPIRDARGQILPLFVISAVALLGLMGLGLDGARAFVERRQAQGAADLAALAGARSLVDPYGVTEQDAAEAEARSIATANGYTSGVTVTFPVNNRIRVTIDSGIQLLFMPLLGMSSMEVDATATAMHEEAVVGTSGGPAVAIFAGSTDCTDSKTLDVTSSFRSTGSWHANATFNSSSPNSALHNGDHTYACVASVGDDYSPPDLVWNTHWALGPQVPNVQDWPIYLLPSDFDVIPGTPVIDCTYPANSSGTYIGSFAVDFNLGSNGPHWVGGTSALRQLNPGTYCGRKITLSVGDTQGPPDGVTFLASQQVSISAGGISLTPYDENVIFAVMGAPGSPQDLDPIADGCRTDAIRVSGSNGVWEGIIYAPCGRADVTGGGSFVVNGSIIANKVHVSGTNWDFNGAAVGGASTESLPEVLALVE